MSPWFVGIDGCRAGWVVATAEGADVPFVLRIERALDLTFAEAERRGGFVAIDVPIGLADDAPRACDLAARAFLKSHRKSSVFPAPCRATLAATTYREACDLNRRASGKQITLELYNILPKIREIDRLMNPARQEQIRESHPEVIFATLAGDDAPPLPPKRDPAGQEARLAILGRFFAGIDLPRLRDERARLLGDYGLRSADLAIDDLIDALACLVTARRLGVGKARVFPETAPRLDARGLRMEIVA